MTTLTTKNREETLILGEKLGRCLKSGDIVLLFGDLGAGKTTLTQGICYGLGLPKGEYVRSPTFTLINEYQGKCPIYHIDLYRMETQEEIEALGLEEVLFDKGVTILEWAEKLLSPEDGQTLGLGIDARVEVRLSYINENKRSFSIELKNLDTRIFPDFSLQ